MRVLPLIGLLAGIALAAFPAEGCGEDSALAALDAFLADPEHGSNRVVLGMVGFYGETQPPQWLVLSADRAGAKVLREAVVSGGEVRSERRFRRLAGRELPEIPLERSTLRVDSTEAFRIAEDVARNERVGFESVHYQLRCRETGREPVWMLHLVGKAQVSRGVVYVSATSGEVLRVSWVRPSVESFASGEGEG